MFYNILTNLNTQKRYNFNIIVSQNDKFIKNLY